MSTSLLYHAFGIKGVKYIRTKYTKGHTIIYAEVTPKLESCPICKSKKTIRRKGSKHRLIRMVPIGKRHNILDLKIWRIRCLDCGALRWPKLPFVKGKSRHTRQFARFAMDLLHLMTIAGVSKILGVGWDLIKDLHKEYLQKRYKSPPLTNLKYMAIDEFSLRKGHTYISIFLDLETGRILHAVEGKSGQDIEPFLKKLAKKAPRLEAIAMDMNTGFHAAVQEHLPNVAIVFDHYHVSALINKAIDDLRREQHSQLDEAEKQVLKGSRFLLLKNYEKLDEDGKDRLQSLLDTNKTLFTMYTMKEQFRDFWEKPNIAEAIVFLDAWCTDAEKSGIKHLMKVSKTLMHHSHGLLNFFYHRISCGLIEGINNKIKTLKRQAYGFRDIPYFKLRLYHLHAQAYSLTG